MIIKYLKAPLELYIHNKYQTVAGLLVEMKKIMIDK